MRVAIDIGPLHGHRTGVGHAVAHIVDHLSTDDRVSTTGYLLSYRAHPQPGQIRLPVPARAATRIWSRIDRPRADRWLGDVDVVHGTNYTAPPTQRPTVITVYDCWFLEHPREANPDVARAGRILRRAVDRGAWIHTSSDATAQRARALLDTDRIRAIHLGPPPAITLTDATPPPIADIASLLDRGFVVALGTTEHRKRHPWLVRAMAAADTSAHLVIAGAHGDDSAELHRSVAALPAPMRERVHLLGPVPVQVKNWLMGHARALAYPSLDEGFGFPVLEAHAAGVPVLASSAGSIPEVAGDAAILVDTHDIDGFATALTDMCRDGAHREALIAAGVANLARFDWTRTVDALVALYSDAVNTDTGGRRP